MSKLNSRIFFAGITVLFFVSFAGLITTSVFSQEKVGTVEMDGDQIEFSMDKKRILATGNVVIAKDDVSIYSDRLEFYQDSQIAILEGNVVLDREEGRFEGDRMKFNFKTMEGSFLKMRIMSDPIYGEGEKILKIGDNHIRMLKGYLTMCDLDKPHFKFYSKKIDIFPKDKAVAKHVRLLVGKVPLLYIPKFVQDLSGKRPVVTVTPGYDKNWGGFLLSRYNFLQRNNLKGVFHLDYRERKDLAWGFDMDYVTKKYGEGVIRTYYMNERSIDAKRFFDERTSPTIEKERFKVEWRHQWEIDDKTNAIWQYYKISDNTLLKDYFEREYDKDPNPTSYFLIARGLSLGTLSFRSDVRVNRFTSQVEKLPEIRYDLSSKQLGKTGLYLKNATTFSNLVKKTASPSEDRDKTMRLDTDNELSYPMKVGFVEFKPYVGSQQTYYSRTIDPVKDNSVRGVFRTGANLSTKFYRIFDVNTNKWGLDINRLRHIITPSIDYGYAHEPTMRSTELDQFDSIDARAGSHKITFSVENKLQTKRNGDGVDLARMVIGSDFNLKEHPGKGGFNTITADIDVTPLSWLSFYMDSSYDAISEKLTTINHDLYVNTADDTWYAKVGKRWHADVDDQLTTELGYRPNKKWKFRVYQRFDLGTGSLKEQEYTITRDLHCWEVNVSFNETKGQGSEIWLVFTMKAFPDIGFDVSTRFNRRKPGSQ